MASPVTPPRGMRDFLPGDKARREHVLARIRGVYRAHGFDEIETPVMEDAARLHAGLGGDNEKLAFAVMRRALTTDDLRSAATALDLADLGLRFDLTVPLARFYASNRGQLPGVFRAIQIAPVWRAERPQKGRFRQFVQCDIDIIGEPGVIAEIELIAATSSALDALGIPGCSIRINDRRLLTSMLTVLGFAPESHAEVLITLDKLDKIGTAGVLAELRERGHATDAIEALAAVPAFAAFGAEAASAADGSGERRAPAAGGALTAESIASLLPAGVDEAALTDLAAIAAGLGDAVPLVFDPFLVRGMGYYTGPIFEVAHPELGYSLGGGGRYDGMIGRFLGSDVPATGFSLGFERLIDLVELPEGDGDGDAALVYDRDVSAADLMALKSTLVAEGARVRLVKRPKNMRTALDQLAADGFARFATVSASTGADASALDWRPLERSA
ncbi:histidine--tRNA ligase [Yonghaparkia sp. Root332]|uniref:histidine--tRNA ligase n=1 Tax=Yonghaparkia sp. Root332 TaxID=1736516 RepID=UPI0006F3C37D|nr:histidine--tRNA ligase [Yonghaparkia sp. Root332]KQV26384.1 histidine--tRNA ligase [Yonghaparkia sp. Root332]